MAAPTLAHVALLAMAGLAFAGCLQASPPAGGDGADAPPPAAQPAASSSAAPSRGPATPGRSGPSTSTVAPTAAGGNVSAVPGPDDRFMARPVLLTPRPLPDLTIGPGRGEPNIHVAPDGTIYVSPLTPLYRSDDGGLSFHEVWEPADTGDSSQFIDAQGNVHWLGLAPGLTCNGEGRIPYQVSYDRGATFSPAVDLSDTQGSDRQWIAGLPNGTLYSMWHDCRGLVTRTSFDSGATWTQPLVRDVDGARGPLIPDLRNPGRIYQAHSCNDVSISISDDHGLSWHDRTITTVATNAPTCGGTSFFAVAAVDTAGTVYVTWSAALPQVASTMKETDRNGVFLSYSVDAGETWSQPLVISDPTKDGRLPWITAGKPGRVAIVWYENVNGLPGEWIPDEWNVRMWESVTADSAMPESVTVNLNAASAHLGSICTSGLACSALDRSLLEFLGVTLGNDGQPVATWMSSRIGTGVYSVEGPDVHFGGVTGGTPLR